MSYSKKIYKVIKNLIHNENKITKEDIVEIIKETAEPIVNTKLDWLIKNKVNSMISNHNIISSLCKIVDKRIEDLDGNSYTFTGNKDKFINSLILKSIEKRVDEILKDQITEKMIYEILKEKFK